MPKARSVEQDVEGFCGWPFLLELIQTASTPFLQGLMAALFETGGRISEILALRRDNVLLSHPNTVKTDPDIIIVNNMILLKRFKRVGKTTKYKCVGHCRKRWDQKPSPEEYKIHKIKKYKGWITEPLKDFRTFPIRMDEPLTPFLVSWIKACKTKLLFPLNRSTAYVRIQKIGKKLDRDIPFCNIRSGQIYDHWFRAERACQLSFDYGFDDRDLDEFFGWKERKPRMSRRYASLAWIGLARKMGVKVEISPRFEKEAKA